MKIREILERLCNNSMDDIGYAETHEEEVIQAEQDIKKAVIEGLPKDLLPETRIANPLCEVSFNKGRIVGYNSYLKDIKERLK